MCMEVAVLMSVFWSWMRLLEVAAVVWRCLCRPVAAVLVGVVVVVGLVTTGTEQASLIGVDARKQDQHPG